MTEGLTIEPGASLWRSADFARREARRARRSADLVRSPVLPEVQPGQLWLAEIGSMEPVLASLEYRALTSANVVIYDRTLAPTVGRLLPLGSYAEPAARGHPPSGAMWERCLRFAREGWSVARLVQPSRARLEEVRRLSKLLLGRNLPAHPPISAFVNLGRGVYERFEIPLGDLDAAVDLPDLEQFPLLTIVCDIIGGEAAPYLSAASTNGLAG